MTLLILGEGPERPVLARCANEHGVERHVLMPGFIQYPWSYFGRASVLPLVAIRGIVLDGAGRGDGLWRARGLFPVRVGPGGDTRGRPLRAAIRAGRCGGSRGGLRTALGDASAVSRRTEAASRRAEEFAQEAVLPGLERRIAALLG